MRSELLWTEATAGCRGLSRDAPLTQGFILAQNVMLDPPPDQPPLPEE